MLRIFVFEEPFSVKLRLEGQLTSQTVPLLTQRWADVRSSLKGRKAILDLGDLVEFDAAGRSTLRWLANSGARLGYAHPKVRQLVDDLALEGPGVAASLLRLWKRTHDAASRQASHWRESQFIQRLCAFLPAAVRPCGCGPA
jgi:anti-anti-sigma regulatory factor